MLGCNGVLQDSAAAARCDLLPPTHTHQSLADSVADAQTEYLADRLALSIQLPNPGDPTMVESSSPTIDSILATAVRPNTRSMRVIWVEMLEHGPIATQRDRRPRAERGDQGLW